MRLAWGPAGRAGALVAVASALVLGVGASERRGLETVPAARDVDLFVYLIGDAGDPSEQGEPVLLALGRELERDPARSLVVFLGDNLYPKGLPAPGAAERRESERRLDAQVDVVRSTGARGIFLPGNHDWEKERRGGWEAVKRQAAHVVGRGAPLVDFLPRQGCPGPEVVDSGSRVRLVVLDTQWWLHEGPKPADPTSECGADSEGEVLAALRLALGEARERQVVVVAHHPLATGGPHGGYFSFREHVFPLTDANKALWIPLPFVGSLYPLSRRAGASPQDLSHEANRRMREALEGVFREHPPLVYASGHEHTLQVLEGQGARTLLVSGAGVFGHTSSVRRIERSRFASSDAGFMRLDVERSGRVRLAVLAADKEGRTREAHSEWLAAGPTTLSGSRPAPP